MDLIVRLQLIQSTLDGISVSGRPNLERLLGSMQEIDRIENALRNQVVLQESGTAKQLTGQEETDG